MRRIVLASASPQRKNLMKVLGVPFDIVPSKAEESSSMARGVSYLVRHNARLKAQDVASREKNALIIGCDTVVLSGKKRLILKPKDLREAKKNLKELMAHPHWVYSGIVVIDSKTGKSVSAVEKTKLVMSPMSDKAIDRYHARVSPLDKAGGFDIEGTGALFIPRIEGCYFNVVGLPLAALGKMLAKFGVEVI